MHTVYLRVCILTFDRAAQAHGVELTSGQQSFPPPLTGKARLAYAAMADEQARQYNLVKVAILQHYDINEETYWRRFRSVKPLENEIPLELVIKVRDLHLLVAHSQTALLLSHQPGFHSPSATFLFRRFG